jgi:hypothetical protein
LAGSEFHEWRGFIELDKKGTRSTTQQHACLFRPNRGLVTQIDPGRRSKQVFAALERELLYGWEVVLFAPYLAIVLCSHLE